MCLISWELPFTFQHLIQFSRSLHCQDYIDISASSAGISGCSFPWFHMIETPMTHSHNSSEVYVTFISDTGSLHVHKILITNFLVIISAHCLLPYHIQANYQRPYCTDLLILCICCVSYVGS